MSATQASDASRGDVVLIDARGTLCPVPIIRLGKATRSAPDRSAWRLLATDSATVHDVPAWCRMTGNTLLSTSQEHTQDGESYYVFDIGTSIP